MKTNPDKLMTDFQMGDKDEADYYASFAYFAWLTAEGAIEWLKKIAL